MDSSTQSVDRGTIIGLGLLLLPLTTMWHEIGGHAAACVLTGGHVDTIGAFYVDCGKVTGAAKVIVASAGVSVDALLSLLAHGVWRRVRGDTARLAWWLIWVGKGFVAAGYLCFSGATGAGDLGPGIDGGIGPLPYPIVWRVGEFMIGVAVYALLIMAAIRALTTMLGNSPATGAARKRIAHGYYVTIGLIAVLIGLLNPVGVFITIMSAAASSFGGNAGFISIGYANGSGTELRPFIVPRNWPMILVGATLAIGFAIVLGPSRRF